jgi:homoserine kinase
VPVWSHYEQTAAVAERLHERADGWAEVLRVPFESHGADVVDV